MQLEKNFVTPPLYLTSCEKGNKTEKLYVEKFFVFLEPQLFYL